MKYFFISVGLFVMTLSANSQANDITTVNDKVNAQATQVLSSAKKALMHKLANLSAFKADFQQSVFAEEGQLLQQNQGMLAVSKPNLLYWHVTTPDESLIVSDGNTLWFYDPFIEQVTLYAIDNAINNTPVLLLVSPDLVIWQAYQVQQLAKNRFMITSKDENSQVKSLELIFADKALTDFVIIDATGQISRIKLLNNKPLDNNDKALFHFTPSAGVEIDDQR